MEDNSAHSTWKRGWECCPGECRAVRKGGRGQDAIKEIAEIRTKDHGTRERNEGAGRTLKEREGGIGASDKTSWWGQRGSWRVWLSRWVGALVVEWSDYVSDFSGDFNAFLSISFL